MNEIRIGDCVELMRAMLAEGIQVQTCITSPPYYGLRDYGTASWDGGDPACDHVERTAADCHASSTLGPNRDGLTVDNAAFKALARQFTDRCGKCGAVRIDSQLGLEKTPAEYLEKMVDVFRLVRELLADDGTLWLNMGDSYANDGKWGGETGGKHVSALHGTNVGRGKKITGMKPKDLMGMPWRLAFALQADGWYLRSDIIWHKPNPMPESVTDRPTKSHEYIFLLSKSEQYFYDADAIRTPLTESSIERLSQNLEEQHGCDRVPGKTNGPMKAVMKAILKGSPQSYAEEYEAVKAKGTWPSGGISKYAGSIKSEMGIPSLTHPLGANKRSVWTVATEAYSEAHFATFPRALIVPCVLAGSRAGDIVFDPFMGSGTTALVAKENGRRYLGCELNPEYAKLQADRLRQEVLFRG